MDIIKNFNLKVFLLDKKSRYFFLSLITTFGLFILNRVITNEYSLFAVVLILIVVGLLGLVYALYLNENFRPTIFSFLLPAHLAVGYFLSFYYFPNLGPLIRVLAYLSFGIIVYLVFLINNIFLVVIEKGSLIPLYNVAVTWVQILVIVVSIPFISGVYKIPVNFALQNIVIFASAMMFNYYMIWATFMDPDTKRVNITERGVLAVSLAVIPFTMGISISFFPSESFLRALFISSILMFNLSYIHAHFKNRINRKMLAEYGLISLIFLFLLVLFHP